MNMKRNFIIATGLLFISQLVFSQTTKNETLKEKQIDGVTLTKTKKAVEQKADRTIFDFSEQAHLNTGNVSEGLKKLPGLIVSDVAGMMYQGKQLDVYMDGRPLNIGGNQLQAFLEGMPANSVERVEIVTQPGSEFPATSGGAIINIITNKNAQKYLSATYTGRYAFTNYEKYRNRTNNSILLNAKNKYFGWQLNFGQNYREAYRESIIDKVSNVFSEQVNRGYFVKSALTFNIGKDRLLVNYDINHNNNDTENSSSGFIANRTGTAPNYIYSIDDYTTKDFGETENWRKDLSATYQIKFDDKNKKLDLNASYNTFDSNYNLDGKKFINSTTQNNNIETTSHQNVATFRIDYSQPIKILDEGKISFGGLFEKLNYDTDFFGITNLEYQRQTTSTYAELQAKKKNFDFILGTRAEAYDISGKTIDLTTGKLTKDLIPFKKFSLFPNASIQYNFGKQVYFALNYNRKIQLPNISWLNPNNTNYQNGNISFGGNPNLQPTIFNNLEAKFSVFDYAFIGYNLSIAENQSIQFAEKKYFFAEKPIIENREAYGVSNGFINVSSMKVHNFNFGLPIPFMLFTKGLKETMKFNINPDKMNFLYVYTGYQLHQLPDNDNKGFWIFNIMAQFILPKDIKLVANYGTMTKGNWYYYRMEKPWMNSFDLTATKKFLNDRLTVSVFANDLFRSNVNAVTSLYNNSNLYLGNNFDSQNFGISINYKLPTKNKLVKEDPNLLKQDKKEDSGLPNQ